MEIKKVSDEQRDFCLVTLYHLAQIIHTGLLQRWMDEMKALKPCVANPSDVDNILDWLEEVQKLSPVVKRHWERWQREAQKINNAGKN